MTFGLVVEVWRALTEGVLVVVEVVMATVVEVVVNVCTVVCNDYKKCQNYYTQISANTF
jgi:hypothetical protein